MKTRICLKYFVNDCCFKHLLRLRIVIFCGCRKKDRKPWPYFLYHFYMRLLLVQNKKLFGKKTRGHQTPIMWNICKKNSTEDVWECCKYACETRGRFLTFWSPTYTLFEHFRNSTSFKNHYT